MTTLTATLIERDVVMVSGVDAGEYLQTQLTQDVLALDPGASAWSFLLGPKSEIVALLRVTRSESDTFLLDVEPGWGDTVRNRIDGLLFRMDVSFDQGCWPGIAWRGGSPDAVDAPIFATTPWQGVEGVDSVGPDVAVPEGVALVSREALDEMRIRAGWPAMGSDLESSIRPAMTGLVDRTISFDKGCYTGQEFVARVHYRGAEPPKRLVRIANEGGASLPVGAPIVVAGDEVGTVTSSGIGVALGYLKRGIETPTSGSVGDITVEIGGSQSV
ncbi:MAG: hypothetical protein QGD89_08695 [Actinomycetota bacterium]|nr:hypothetical protein [Actinomycetota bacterium]